MAKAKNKVVSGDYSGYPVVVGWGRVAIGSSVSNMVVLDKATLESVEIMDQATKKDVGSSVARGLVGGLLLGPVGLVGGALLGKSADTNILAVTFKDGKRSMLEVDEKIFKELQKIMF